MFALFLPAVAAPDYASFAKDPRDTLLADRATPAGFRIVALSHLAEACAEDEDVGCVERVARAGLHPRIRPIDPGRTLGDHGLYLSHLAVILGRCAELEGACDADLHERIVVHLAERSAAEGVIASFPATAHRYPADQAVTLHAIHLHDRTRNTAWLAPALAAYHEALEAVPSSGPTGLPPSELAGTHEWSSVPRGCALTWTVQYLADVDPDYARSLWDGLQRWMFVVVGPAAGVREWPLGEDRPADLDSGPIVLGVGAAATAFGIGAAHAMDDPVRTAQLEGTEWLVRQQGHPAADSALAVAISEASKRR